MVYYIRLVYYYIDDDYVYNMIISFNNKEDIIEFKNRLEQDKTLKYITVSKNSVNEWIKEYVDNTTLISQPKPHRITTKDYFESVLKQLKTFKKCKR